MTEQAEQQCEDCEKLQDLCICIGNWDSIDDGNKKALFNVFKQYPRPDEEYLSLYARIFHYNVKNGYHDRRWSVKDWIEVYQARQYMPFNDTMEMISNLEKLDVDVHDYLFLF